MVSDDHRLVQKMLSLTSSGSPMRFFVYLGHVCFHKIPIHIVTFLPSSLINYARMEFVKGQPNGQS